MTTVYMGWDPAEAEAYRVAEKSCKKNASAPVDVIPLKADDHYRWRLLWRPVERYGGQMFDHLSGAPQSTEFAISRFLVPFLHKTGWALFCDCDVVFLDDVHELFALADPKYAVMCVKHQQEGGGRKMGGQTQTSYARKNWSSILLWNCDHTAHHRLTLAMVNSWPGALLHRFSWLKDEEIGELPHEWNWLVNVTPKPEHPKIVHYTLGGAWLKDHEPDQYDDIWLKWRNHEV